MKAIVYSSVTRGYDTFKPGRDIWFIDSQYVIGNPKLQVRYPKICIQELVDVDYSLYLDGSVNLKPGISIHELIDIYLSGGNDLAIVKHPERDCLYDEGEAIVRLEKESNSLLVDKQLERYRRLEHPEHWGLARCGIILRRHTRDTRLLGLRWWDELCNGTQRDQVSFPFVLRNSEVKFRMFRDTSWFDVEKHARKGMGFP